MGSFVKGVLRTSNIIVGAVVVVLGLYVHWFSHWTGHSHLGVGIKLYQICYHHDLSNIKSGSIEYERGDVTVIINFIGTRCPRVTLELYFLVVVISSLLFSLACVAFFSLNDAGIKKVLATWCYRINAIFLVTAPVAYGISCILLKRLDLHVEQMYASVEAFKSVPLNFMYEAKYANVCLTIILSFGYLLLSILIARG